MAKLNLSECKRMVETEGAAYAVQRIGEWAQAGQVRMRDQSLQEMFVAFVPDGEARLRAIMPKQSGGFRLQEAVDATSTAAFASVLGQITYAEVKEAYESPELLWPKLFTSRPTKLPKGERIPGIGKIGDKAGTTGEGGEYPLVGPTEEYFDRPALTKNGFRTRLTRELMIEDNIGGIVDCITAGQESMAISAEKRAIAVATGQVNTYKRNGTATNTFLTSGAYTNSFTGNALYDFNSIDTVYQGMAALTDPNTGEPINFDIDNLLVPPALRAKAFHAQNMTQVERVDNTAGATTVRSIAGNPFAGVIKNVMVSQYVKLATSSDTQWFGGRFQKACRRFYAWDVETETRTDLDSSFYNDVILEYKTSVYDGFFIYEPRYIFKSTA